VLFGTVITRFAARKAVDSFDASNYAVVVLQRMKRVSLLCQMILLVKVKVL